MGVVNRVYTGGEWHFEGYSGVIRVEAEASGTPTVVCLT